MSGDADRGKALTEALERAVEGTVYVNRDQQFSAVQLRAAYRNRRWGDPTWQFVSGAERKTPVIALKQLADRLRPLLTKFLEPATDRLGNGLFRLFGGFKMGATPTVEEFGDVLVRGAERLGAARVTELLLGWIEGEPLHIRQCAIIEGVSIEGPLHLEEGVGLEILPSSSKDLPASLPDFVSAMEFIGGVVLSLDHEQNPSLCMPGLIDKSASLTPGDSTVVAANRIPNLTIETFCESMSLACGEHVDWRVNWPDHGELEAFSSFRLVQTSSKPRWNGGWKPFEQKHLDRAREIHLVRHGNGSIEKRRDVELAISRWLKSKSSTSDADKLIELRIALEALYGRRAMNEKGFRVSTYGAWHLGESVEDRRRVRETLRKAYDDASRAIHAGNLKHVKRDGRLLPLAQALCLKGILKRLGEAETPAWDELILGERHDGDGD